MSGLALSVSLGTSVNSEAWATTLPQRSPTLILTGDHNNNGNGSGNATSVAIRSPARLMGIQDIADANVLSLVNTNNAVCKKRRFCWIRQRAINVAH
jgi:hypothetical protein